MIYLKILTFNIPNNTVIHKLYDLSLYIYLRNVSKNVDFVILKKLSYISLKAKFRSITYLVDRK